MGTRHGLCSPWTRRLHDNSSNSDTETTDAIRETLFVYIYTIIRRVGDTYHMINISSTHAQKNSRSVSKNDVHIYTKTRHTEREKAYSGKSFIEFLKLFLWRHQYWYKLEQVIQKWSTQRKWFWKQCWEGGGGDFWSSFPWHSTWFIEELFKHDMIEIVQGKAMLNLWYKNKSLELLINSQQAPSSIWKMIFTTVLWVVAHKNVTLSVWKKGGRGGEVREGEEFLRFRSFLPINPASPTGLAQKSWSEISDHTILGTSVRTKKKQSALFKMCLLAPQTDTVVHRLKS